MQLRKLAAQLFADLSRQGGAVILAFFAFATWKFPAITRVLRGTSPRDQVFPIVVNQRQHDVLARFTTVGDSYAILLALTGDFERVAGFFVASQMF